MKGGRRNRDDEYKKGYDEGYEEARKEFENQEPKT